MNEKRGILRVSKRLLAEALGSLPDDNGHLPWRIERVITERQDIHRQDYVEFVVCGAGCADVEEGQIIPDVTGLTSANYDEDGALIRRETKLRVA